MNSTENLCQWDWKCNECGEVVDDMMKHHSLAHWGFVENIMVELTFTKIKRGNK